MDDNIISVEKAKAVLDGGMEKATELIKDNTQIDELINKVQAKIDEVPMLKQSLENVGTVFSLIKSYVKKEYTEVSPKVIATVVSAFLYLLKKKDILSDNIPIIGILDDLAVAAVALKFVQPELDAYTKWKEENKA